MITSKQTLLIALMYPLITLISCQSSKKDLPTSNRVKNPVGVTNSSLSWSHQMQKLTFHLSEILPIISDPNAKIEGESKKSLESKMAEIQNIAHELNDSTPTPDKDPSLKLIGKRFEENIQLANESIQTGHLNFSRNVFKNALAQCVQCHTRLETGPTLTKPPFMSNIQNIPIVERVQFLLASRYFEDAINEINKAIAHSESLSIVSWQKLVQMGLIINVRFYNDVKKTSAFLTMLDKSPNLPFFIRRHTSFWNKSIQAWNLNPKPSVDLNSAQQIISRAESAQKSSRSDGGSIDFLRAGNLLHQFLAKTQVPSAKAEALYQLGLIYENIGEIGAWSLNEDYYELCLKTNPHSEIAKKCFARYQESTISGFSGTGGLFIPEEIQKKMNELRALAL